MGTFVGGGRHCNGAARDDVGNDLMSGVTGEDVSSLFESLSLPMINFLFVISSSGLFSTELMIS